MSGMRWDGTATAMSSVVHGEQALGTVTYLRRERFIMPDGTVEEIPVVSGNAWRGLLRRTAADLWWDAVGRPKMTLAVAHAIWSGGALAKSTGTALTGSRLLRVRQACPPVGLFGAAGGGRIVDGCVQVGKMIPVCQETAHVLPEKFRDEDRLPSVWDLTQVEEYSKIAREPALAGPGEADEPIPPARFGVETFLAGTRFYIWLAASWMSGEEQALLLETLDTFTAAAHVGGMGRAGHGRLRLDLALTSGSVPDPLTDWRTAVRSQPDIPEVIAWLD